MIRRVPGSVWCGYFQSKFQRGRKAPLGWVRRDEAALTAGSHSGKATVAAPPAIVLTTCVRPAWTAAEWLLRVDNAGLLCWWLAAQALSGHTADLIARAGYNQLTGTKNSEWGWFCVAEDILSLSFFLFHNNKERVRQMKEYLNSCREQVVLQADSDNTPAVTSLIRVWTKGSSITGVIQTVCWSHSFTDELWIQLYMQLNCYTSLYS